MILKLKLLQIIQNRNGVFLMLSRGIKSSIESLRRGIAGKRVNLTNTLVNNELLRHNPFETS